MGGTPVCDHCNRVSERHRVATSDPKYLVSTGIPEGIC
jgi:hypothetical protein